MRQFFAMAALMLFAVVSTAAELTLFDIPLRTASRDEIRSAITQAGGRLESSSRDIDHYDAQSIGLPGVKQLEVVYLENRLVMAQYNFGEYSPQEERLRKMLVAKYGQPHEKNDFDSEYIRDGKYHWSFNGGMELAFTKEFIGPLFLSYVNKVEDARLGALVKAADKRAAEKEAAAKSSVF